MSEIRDAISQYSDNVLLDQYFNHRDEFTPEAAEILREELTKRKLSFEVKDYLDNKPDEDGEPGFSPLQFKTEDFVPFDHTFSQIDIILAHTILRESKIPFFNDNPTSTEIIPIESEASKRYTIHIHKDYVVKTHEAFGVHFEKSDGAYALKQGSFCDRLLAFNFHDIRISELAAKENIEVSINSDEKKTIVSYAKRLLDEADIIEQKQDRVLFYYDSFDLLVEKLEKSGSTTLTRSDMLAMLEIFQVYCEEEDFPQSLESTISSLLGFFLE